MRLGSQISPWIDFGAEVHFNAWILTSHPIPLVFHHVFEVGLDVAQGLRVVNVDVAIALRNGRAKIFE